ncbi:tetratricopeptide repeat protein [Floridanema aerugineum]|uniref:Tetratricopeptide repeat protein n=1 Tax=Floridaenema aerugineum BLCC-F46 TaxID=3153654 RepID=A0ABV4X4P4_9CYAN
MTKAWECLRVAPEIFREICEVLRETLVRYNLAELFYQMGELDFAVSDFNRALSIVAELGIPLQQDCTELKKEVKYTYE